ncbi:hypothetical protein ISS30_02395 [bacterium]|nr:hypothetical protein [bacterium]
MRILIIKTAFISFIMTAVMLLLSCSSSKIRYDMDYAAELERKYPGFKAYRHYMGGLEYPDIINPLQSPAVWDGLDARQGIAVMIIHLSASGEVKNYEFSKSFSVNLYTEIMKYSEKVVNTLEFSPAKLDGGPVECIIHLNIPFGWAVSTNIDRTQPILMIPLI